MTNRQTIANMPADTYRREVTFMGRRRNMQDGWDTIRIKVKLSCEDNRFCAGEIADRIEDGTAHPLTPTNPTLGYGSDRHAALARFRGCCKIWEKTGGFDLVSVIDFVPKAD